MEFFCVDYNVSFFGGNVVIVGGEVECFNLFRRSWLMDG